jgi:chromosome segregation ATPase
MYVIMTAETLNAPAINVVNSGTYSMSSPDVSLLSLEPNYYSLYTELKESYDTLIFTLGSTQDALDEMTDEAGLLRDEIGALNVQLQNLAGRVNHLETEDPLSGDLTDLQQQVEILSGTWNGLTDSMDQLNDEINALMLEVAAVKVRLEESEQSTFMAIAVTVSFVSLILGSTSLWRSFTNNK